MNKKYWRLVCNYKDAKPDEEDWIEDSWLDCTPEQCIENFNASLYPGERERILIGALPLIEKNKPHSWVKNNLVTQTRRGIQYDTYKCGVCGVTGKRFSLSGGIVPDSKFKKDKYCK